MGCSASKNAVESIDTNMQKPNSATASIRSTVDTLEQNSRKSSSNVRYPPGEAFVVPLNDIDDEGACNDSFPGEDSTNNIKQPPKRLQQLMIQASTTSSPKKIEDLQQKLERADARRQQYLQQKLDSIQKTTQMIVKNSELKIGEEAASITELNSHKKTSDIISTSLDDDSKHALLKSS